MRRDPNYLHSHPIPYTKVNQPRSVFLSSPLFPLIKHSHIMHTLPHKNPIFPLQPYNNLALMFSRSTSVHETSNVPDAAGTQFNVAKSHKQHVANAAWSEDLPSNTTMPAKLSSPISPNCMFSFLFMNIAHLYAKYRQKNKLLADYCDSSNMFICYAKHCYMTVYLIVRSKSLISLFLEVTEYPDLEVGYVCI